MDNNTSVRYCYYRDDFRAPRITLCRYEEDGRICYGWAICSPQDTPCKKTGKTIALQRAIYAFCAEDPEWQFPRIYLNKNTPPRHDGATDTIRACHADGFYALVARGDRSKLMEYMQ